MIVSCHATAPPAKSASAWDEVTAAATAGHRCVATTPGTALVGSVWLMWPVFSIDPPLLVQAAAPWLGVMFPDSDSDSDPSALSTRWPWKLHVVVPVAVTAGGLPCAEATPVPTTVARPSGNSESPAADCGRVSEVSSFTIYERPRTGTQVSAPRPDLSSTSTLRRSRIAWNAITPATKRATAGSSQ